MITLRQFAWEVHRILNGGKQAKDSEYDSRYTMDLIRKGMNEVVPLERYRKRNEDDDKGPIAMYIASYKISVDEDTDRKCSKATIPEFYHSEVWNRGIRAVSFVDEPNNPHIQRRHPEVSEKLPCGKLQGNIGYYVEGFTIFWDEKLKKQGKEVKKVLLRLLIAAPDSIGEDDPLPIIPEQQAVIMDRVLAWYGKEGIQDKVNDENKDLNVRVQQQQ